MFLVCFILFVFCVANIAFPNCFNQMNFKVLIIFFLMKEWLPTSYTSKGTFSKMLLLVGFQVLCIIELFGAQVTFVRQHHGLLIILLTLPTSTSPTNA